MLLRRGRPRPRGARIGPARAARPCDRFAPIGPDRLGRDTGAGGRGGGTIGGARPEGCAPARSDRTRGTGAARAMGQRAQCRPGAIPGQGGHPLHGVPRKFPGLIPRLPEASGLSQLLRETAAETVAVAACVPGNDGTPTARRPRQCRASGGVGEARIPALEQGSARTVEGADMGPAPRPATAGERRAWSAAPAASPSCSTQRRRTNPAAQRLLARRERRRRHNAAGADEWLPLVRITSAGIPDNGGTGPIGGRIRKRWPDRVSVRPPDNGQPRLFGGLRCAEPLAGLQTEALPLTVCGTPLRRPRP